MNYEILHWDSDFFGIKIAKISEFANKNQFNSVLNQLKDEGIQLVYCFTTPENIEANQTYYEFGQLVDKKVTYYQKIKKKQYILDKNIELYNLNSVTPELLELALQSGEFSRFKVDPKFPKGSFEKLYTKWIENSVNKKFDDAVYVYIIENSIKGLLTLKDKDNIGTISLIGVDKTVRGQSIGSKLTEATFYHYSNKNIFDIEVVTQLDNQLACKFYEKNNFKIKNIQNIYHLWI